MSTGKHEEEEKKEEATSDAVLSDRVPNQLPEFNTNSSILLHGPHFRPPVQEQSLSSDSLGFINKNDQDKTCEIKEAPSLLKINYPKRSMEVSMQPDRGSNVGSVSPLK